MRLFLILFLCVAAAPALARPADVVRPTQLRSGPGERFAPVGMLEPGSTVNVIRPGVVWSRASFADFVGFVRNRDLRKLMPRDETPGGLDPWCDAGYPYSGSARYFTGLTALRHTGFAGALLGEHVYRPCPPPSLITK